MNVASIEGLQPAAGHSHYAAAKAADTEPLPYLLICAFIANAASFVLPISNPANLVIYGSRMPPLLAWLAGFAFIRRREVISHPQRKRATAVQQAIQPGSSNSSPPSSFPI